LRESDDEDNNNLQGSDEDNEELLFNQHSVFCQMDMLCDFEDGEVAWKEIARFRTFYNNYRRSVRTKGKQKFQ